MFNRSTVSLLLVALAICGLHGTASAQKYYAQRMADGTIQVYDPATKRTQYVRDIRAWAAKRNFDRTGFGTAISQNEFSKGYNPVQNTVKIAAGAVDGVANTAVNTAIDAAGYVPGWRHYSNGARQVLHGGKAKARR